MRIGHFFIRDRGTMRSIRMLTVFLLVLFCMLFGFTAYKHYFVKAASATIRQEINILDGTLAVSSTSGAIVQLDTNKYSGTVSYYFEIVTAGASASTDSVTLTRSGTTTNDASISLAGTAANTRVRSTAFTPPAGATQYVVKTGANHSIKSARIIVVQTSNPLASTETQIEIGNQETSKVNTTAAALSSPKYWTYTSANWDSGSSFFAEVTLAQSGTNFSTTVTLQQDDGSFGTWSNVANIVSSNVSTGPARFRTSTAFTPLDGKHYRISAAESASNGGKNYSIYNAKIIVDLGQTWSQTGSALSISTASFTSLAALSSTRVTYLDTGQGKFAAYDFNGNSWTQVGSNGAAPVGCSSSITALSSTRVAIATTTTSDNLYVYDFNGSSWTQVGSTFVVNASGSCGPTHFGITGLSSSRIAYIDSAGQLLKTYDFNGSTWSQTGSSLSITAVNAHYGMATLSSSRIVYIDAINKLLKTYDFNGSSWSQTGNSLSVSSYCSGQLAALTSSTVTMINGCNGSSITLITFSFDGTNWSQSKPGSQIIASGANVGGDDGIAAASSTRIFTAPVTSTTSPTASQLRTYDTNIVNKFETQYLLSNTVGSTTGLQGYPTNWDSTEWSGVTNTYKDVMDSTNASSSTKLQDIDNANTDVTGSTATGNNQIFSSAMTMPTSGHQLDANITASATTVTADRIVVQVVVGTVNSSPNIPTLSTPSSGATNISVTPTFTLSTTDADGDTVKYRLYLYQSDCSTAVSGSPFDQATSGTGWDNGTTAYTSGATATYTYQGTLADNTTYCWKADAIDPSGSAVYGTASGTRLFTTKATALSQNHYRWRNDDGYEASGSSSAGVVRPDGDVAAAWTVTGSATHFGALTAAGDQVTQPTAGSASENVSSVTGGQVDTYSMSTISGSGGYNEIDVWVYAKDSGNDSLGISTNIAGTTQQTVSLTNSDAWYKVAFTGLSMNQANLDSLQVTFTQIKNGGADIVTVETMYAEVFNALTGATWRAAQDTVVSGMSTGSNVRLRFEVANTDTQSGSPNLSLEYGVKSGTCSASTYATVPTTSGSAVQMGSSTYFATGDATTSQLTATGTFTAGKMVESASTSTGSITIPASNYTEAEFVFQGNASAAGNTYCFRLTNNGTVLSTYSVYPEITFTGGVSPPTTDQLMRGGTYFSGGTKQPIYWAQ